MNTLLLAILFALALVTATVMGWHLHAWRMMVRAAREPPSTPHQGIPYSELAQSYYELLYQVGSKYPGETRHQTALRYIQQAECRSIDGCTGDASCENN